MRITQTNPLTFEDEIFDIDDYQHSIASDIKEVLEKRVVMPVFELDKDMPPNPAHVTEIIVNDDKLCIGFMKPRKFGETAVKYRITIEKINTNV